MEKFEKQFEDLDVQSGVMENSMSNSVTTSVPQVCCPINCSLVQRELVI